MDKLARTFDLLEPLRERVAGGMPAYGSCAGMIMLADRIVDGRPDQETLGGLDITVRRNAFGRQVDSFEEDLDSAGSAASRCTPSSSGRRGSRRWASRRGAGPRGAGPAAGRIVAVRQGDLLATSFHPEVTGDARVHQLFVEMVRQHIATQNQRERHERPLQVGDHQAQEGGDRRQARQAVRQADQEHRGRGAHRRR